MIYLNVSIWLQSSIARGLRIRRWPTVLAALHGQSRHRRRGHIPEAGYQQGYGAGSVYVLRKAENQLRPEGDS